ncbi:hypothetical protein AB0J83_29190 [Actinoplanes sp. NPDC049596]|uniref:hypothetical protein n=1 Tax=unclassified Actinoplanes TaxID=2626549 RepID=UPI0034393E2F
MFDFGAFDWTEEDEPVFSHPRGPLPEVSPLAGLVAFFDEAVDVTVDGVPRHRPDSPVAKVMNDEFGVS